ncbi:MAG: hypothetical protein HXY50_15345 [Ignavibacteriaceae bacterium]|nr:hypothetical protein [Ignavibacteriaceae bacterium]
MMQKIQILPSGIKLIDEAWGGFYKSGTYLLIGAHKSGRTTLALEYVRACVEQKEVCLFITTRRPKDLILQAASMNFDLQYFISQNSVILVRVDSSISLSDSREPDSVLAEYITDISELISQHQPTKFVFDELTPFIGFSDVKFLEETFTNTFENIEDLGVTSLVVIGDPITPAAKKIVNVLANHSTGILYLQKGHTIDGNTTLGSLVITPNIGHSEGKFSSKFQIIPGKGFSFEPINISAEKTIPTFPSAQVDSKYKPIIQVDTAKDNFKEANIYSYDDFQLFINNQIAFYKSTGQSFTLLSFKVDESDEKSRALFLNQLKNAVRLSIEKKDKLCVMQNKVFVLLTKEDQKDLTHLIARVKSNLCADDPVTQSKIFSQISVYSLNVNDSVNTSEDMLKELRSDELASQNKYRIS